MEVLEATSAMLSNYEVYTVLREQQIKQEQLDKQDAGHKKRPQNVKTMEYEALEYLSQQPCSSQDPEQLTGLLSALKSYPLTKAERLSLINLRPTQLVELYPIVEELDERLNEAQCDQLLALILKHLPRDDDMEDEKGNEDEEGQGDEDTETAE
ncbi:MAG: DNA-directed RNA polymerase III subunit RPC9-like protein, partial [Piptocephalis tieghemiana]